MPPAPEVSCIIPTRNRVPCFRECLGRLGHQTIDPDRFEVIVVLDGPDEASAQCAVAQQGLRIKVVQAARRGIAHAKNEAIAAAEGRLLLLLNDDIEPVPGFIEAHISAHARLDRPAMILGYSPFAIPTTPQNPPPDHAARPDSAFDRLIRETSMIFFYDRMIDAGTGAIAAPPGHDWGCRHAWNLNLSLPRTAALACGGFRPAIANCCYEDVEFAYRLGLPVLFRPEALAPHNHRYTVASYLEREFRLGYSALGFAHAAPECAKSVLRLDLRGPAARGEALRAMEAAESEEPERLARFRALESVPAAALSRAELAEAYESHRPLKRLAFNRGLLAAMDGRRVAELFHPGDGLPVEPPGLLASAA